MFKQQFGKPKEMLFANASEYYLTLGFLAKSDGTASITWEDNQNQGAWEHEVRIHCYKDLHKFPLPLSNKFTVGTGNVLHRINCNEFIEDLMDNHNFIEGGIQDIQSIRNTVPAQYKADFNRGLAL